MYKIRNILMDCGREPIVLLNKNSDIVKKEGFSALSKNASAAAGSALAGSSGSSNNALIPV